MAPIISPYSYMQLLLWRLYSLRPRPAAKPGSSLKFDSQQQRPTTAICLCDANNKNVAESGSMMAKSPAVLREYRSDDFFFSENLPFFSLYHPIHAIRARRRETERASQSCACVSPTPSSIAFVTATSLWLLLLLSPLLALWPTQFFLSLEIWELAQALR